MIDTVAGELELAEFLDAHQQSELRTWEIPRDGARLSEFVLRRLDALDQIDDSSLV